MENKHKQFKELIHNTGDELFDTDSDESNYIRKTLIMIHITADESDFKNFAGFKTYSILKTFINYILYYY